MRRFSLKRARSSFSSVLSTSSAPRAAADGGPLSTTASEAAAAAAAAAGAAPPEHRFPDELDAVRRYEDFTTIDWVQDAAREQLRRRARRLEGRGGTSSSVHGLRRKVWELYDAGQAWIVVTLVGAAIGLNAAFLNIVTEWLSDIKLGHCTTAFYLNENFCCWGAENGMSYGQGNMI